MNNHKDCLSETPDIYIVGRNYVSNLCMARSLASAGYRVGIIRIFEKELTWRNRLGSVNAESRSKYVKRYIPCVLNGDEDEIIKCLNMVKCATKKILLIPNDDLSASMIDLHFEELAEYFYMPNVNAQSGEVDRLMSKAVQKQLALKFGLPMVKNCTVRTASGNVCIPDAVSYPCFIKPNTSKNCTKDIMKKCENKEELQLVLDRLSQTQDIEVLVEDYIEIRKEYSLLGVSTKDGVFSPGLFVVEEGGHGTWKGVTMVGKVLPCSQMQPLIDRINDFIASLHYEGLFDVDLVEAVDGQIYFIELNLRFGGSGYGITGSGVNLPGMLTDYMLLGKTLDQSKSVTSGKRFINEKILVDEYAKGYLNRKEMRKKLQEADIYFIKDKRDPYPYRCLQRYCFLAGMKKARQVFGK